MSSHSVVVAQTIKVGRLLPLQFGARVGFNAAIPETDSAHHNLPFVHEAAGQPSLAGQPNSPSNFGALRQCDCIVNIHAEVANTAGSSS